MRVSSWLDRYASFWVGLRLHDGYQVSLSDWKRVTLVGSRRLFKKLAGLGGVVYLYFFNIDTCLSFIPMHRSFQSTCGPSIRVM